MINEHVNKLDVLVHVTNEIKDYSGRWSFSSISLMSTQRAIDETKKFTQKEIRDYNEIEAKIEGKEEEEEINKILQKQSTKKIINHNKVATFEKYKSIVPKMKQDIKSLEEFLEIAVEFKKTVEESLSSDEGMYYETIKANMLKQNGTV